MGQRINIFSNNCALFSNLILGNGVWTIYQVAAWSIIGCLGALFSNKLDTSMKLILFAGASGVYSVVHHFQFYILLVLIC